MKKIVLLMLSIAVAAFAADGDVANETLKAYSVVAAGIGLGLAALGGAMVWVILLLQLLLVLLETQV